MQIKVEEFVKINPQVALTTFWDMTRWAQIWSPMEEVHVIYQDDKSQEVVMCVDRDGVKEKNRTLRFLEEDNTIDFFSPEPPPMMRHHRGSWQFHAREEGCVIIAEREFSLKNDENENENIKFQEKFKQRLEKILAMFKLHFEEEVQHV